VALMVEGAVEKTLIRGKKLLNDQVRGRRKKKNCFYRCKPDGPEQGGDHEGSPDRKNGGEELLAEETRNYGNNKNRKKLSDVIENYSKSTKKGLG